ncbi:BrnA antitoxin family protein [candidate division KSB1 bacterium]|nr:BrnA antitoxin family protein [candidate division KSB1 bacterium]NIR68835.1 BrnA antitoxin family protein [candidate division KSB1 bacterium]NIS27199.1 BrnA antitoxin family protein [candidate division KSB1 bacterium]NIT74084.1 BrnA antitoxin family protein [candidate division KSB1 bacterium]NIU27933.1 BrnA antitoxin family protein [candidate division KSB1 bacterium]
MPDEDIDYSDIPPLTDEQFAAMKPLRVVFPKLAQRKTRITIRLDSDIVQWFKQQVQETGGNYQSLINQALRDYIAYQNEPFEDILRRVIREELRAVDDGD